LFIFFLYLIYPWHYTLGFGIVMWYRNFWDLAKTRGSPWRYWRPFWTSKPELERRRKRTETLGEEYTTCLLVLQFLDL